MAQKSYDEILQEYERFFSMDKEVLNKDAKSTMSTTASFDTSSLGVGEVRGGNVVIKTSVDFAQALTGV